MNVQFHTVGSRTFDNRWVNFKIRTYFKNTSGRFKNVLIGFQAKSSDIEEDSKIS